MSFYTDDKGCFENNNAKLFERERIFQFIQDEDVCHVCVIILDINGSKT